MLSPATYQRRIAPIVLAALSVLLGTAKLATAWERAHGDGANLNFENVATAPAGSNSTQVTGLGTFALGAGPVVAADGTVYLGNQEGEVIALRADGTPYWRRKIAGHQTIVASPAIGANGIVYVVGISRVTDHRVDPPVETLESSLHRFTASGGYIGDTPFPRHDFGGGAGAPPNIWRFQGKEMVLVPATYRRKVVSTIDVRLIGFSPDGPVVADQIVTSITPDLFGGNGNPDWQNIGCALTFYALCIGQNFDRSGEPPTYPAGVGVFTFAGGGTPIVLASDHLHDVAGYAFSDGAFVELFREHSKDLFMLTAPAIPPDGHAIIGAEDVTIDDYGAPRHSGEGGAVFTGPNLNKVAPIKKIGAISATPTRLADGRVVLLSRYGKLTVLQDNKVAMSGELIGQSLVSPAASQTHVFVSMSGALLTLDAGTLTEVSRVNWSGGGESQPAIGPQGHVYAIASNILHVFPPPRRLPQGAAGVAEPGTPIVTVDPTATQGDTKAFKPPMTMNGNRLFACEELDGDNCGKGDYQTIATAFCKKEGFIGAGQIEVDSKRVKAETLDGRFCSKKKCKVFEHILCANN